MVKKPNWRSALHEYIEARRRLPFVWGTNDCATFAGGAVEAQTGVAALPFDVGSYSTSKGATRMLKSLGFSSLAAAAASILPSIAPSSATAGDLMLVKSDYGQSLGVCAGERVVVMTPDGLGTVDRMEAVAAFKV